MPGFHTGPLTGNQPVELPSQRSSEEEATSSHLVLEEAVKVMEVSYSGQDFEAFNQPQSPDSPDATFSHLPLAQVSDIQEPFDIPDAMVLQRKPKKSLLELIESYAGGFVLEVAV